MSGRKPIAATWRQDDNGHLIHDGDCHFWDRRVCTCGLLHYLRPLDKRVMELMPDFYQQDAAEYVVMDGLLCSDLVKEADEIMKQPVKPLTAEEQAEMDTILRAAGAVESKESGDQKQGTTDAVEILDALFVGDDPERRKVAEEEEHRKGDREQEEYDRTGIDPYE